MTQPEGVTSIAYSPDGQYVATGSYDNTVRVWRTRDGMVQTFTGHSGTVWSVAFSPDGNTIASGGEDKTVRLWRAFDGTALRTLLGHDLIVWSIAFSPDGKWLASGSFDHTIKIWRAVDGTLVHSLLGHSEAIVELAFSPDSKLLATGSDDSTVKLWNVSDGTLVNTLAGESEHVYAVAFSPDGQWLACGSRERGMLGTLLKQVTGNWLSSNTGKSIRLWRLQDGSIQQTFAGLSGDIHSVAFSPDGRWLASSGEAASINLWRIEVHAQTRSMDSLSDVVKLPAP